MHDKRLAEEDAPPFPQGSRAAGDIGYQGYQPEHVQLTIPLKKPKKQELSAEEKQLHTALAKIRIYVEHAIRGIKIYQITSMTFRNTTKGMADQVMEIAAGLYTWKCRIRDTAQAVATEQIARQGGKHHATSN